jgi:hypothetical protein
MKLMTGILVAALVLAGMGTGNATVRITFDRGGRIGDYVDKFRDLLGTLPRDGICVTSHATFGFKATDNPGIFGPVPNPEATRMLYALYPAAVKRWITQQGGLTTHMIYLHGRQLLALYRPCSTDVHASGSRLH